ncbi:conserved hypothetical protein [Theileria equi strain WA]|uniref:Uncharacterized protein n=1 Tax=Theileria equi strain WA TaxID=1537102 RepID=L1LEY5_THEEQ|nr:conserved hypothetical protein [Theileria equi strain WA]EKX73911.1 conserved hypothetical protein [Theileria equi strain WA]|eukprot:XP_004833363.1 conserved hypothetical protein [Theileria equi strain WA]
MPRSGGLLDSQITLNVERFFFGKHESLYPGTHLTEKTTDIRGVVSDGFQYLKSLSHVNVCSYVDMLRSDDNNYVFLSEGYSLTLGDVLERIEKSKWSKSDVYGSIELVGIINQIISGVQYLHSSGIAHGALTLENILVTPDGYVKIWGYAKPYLSGLISRFLRKCNDSEPMDVGIDELSSLQLFYTPPEVILDCKLEANFKVDVWSLGICILTILSHFLHVTASIPVTGHRDVAEISKEKATDLKNAFVVLSSLLYVFGSEYSDEFKGNVSAIGLNIAKMVKNTFPTPNDEQSALETICRASSEHVDSVMNYLVNLIDWITGKRIFDILDLEPGNGSSNYSKELYILGICYDCLIIDPSERPSSLDIALRYDIIKHKIPHCTKSFPRFAWSISDKYTDFISDCSNHEMCRRKYVTCPNTSEYLNLDVGMDDIFYYWKLIGNDPLNLVQSLQMPPLSCLVDENGAIQEGPFFKLEAARKEYTLDRFGLGELFTHIKVASLFPMVLEHQLRPSCGYARQHSFIYQWFRIYRFRKLLDSFNKEKIIAEAKIDIPPLLRKFIWCAILDIEYKNEPCVAVAKSRLVSEIEKVAVFYSNDILRSKKSLSEIASAIEYIENKYAKLTSCFYSFCIPLFLLYHDATTVFREILETIFCKYLKDFYVPSGSFVSTFLAEFTTLLNFFDPKVASHLRSIGAYADSYALPWFMTLFAENLSVHQLYIIMDAVVLRPRSFVKYLAVATVHCMRENVLGLASSHAFTSFISCAMETINMPMLVNLAISLYNRWNEILTLGKDEASSQSLDRGTFTFIMEEFPFERCFRLPLDAFSSVLNNCILVDLRPLESYNFGSIPNSIHVDVLLNILSDSVSTGNKFTGKHANAKLNAAIKELQDKTNLLWLHKSSSFIIIAAGDGYDLEEEMLYIQRLTFEFNIRHLCYYRINADEWPRVLTLAKI